MATDDKGREGLSAGALAKELGVSAGRVKKTLVSLGIEPDFIKGNCGYYYAERTARLKKALTET
jgi:hypothetical protein